MSQHLSLLSTPSGGVDEVVKALQRHAHGRTATIVRLRRHFGPRVTQANLSTALASAVTAGFVTNDGSGNYSLTDTGVRHARSVTNRYLYTT